MDKEEIIRRLKKISEHAVHVTGEPPFILSLDDGIALNEAVSLLKEQEHKDRMFHALEDDWKRLKELLKEQEAVVRCKDCIYGKHEKNDSTGMEWIYCQHHRENRPEDWFCASGSRI